jgi:predicted molibdopterin-dependent oxidoreductase YjgC
MIFTIDKRKEAYNLDHSSMSVCQGSGFELKSTTDEVSSEHLFIPIHFNNPNVNTLMSAVPLDPQARMPALKVIPARIERFIC